MRRPALLLALLAPGCAQDPAVGGDAPGTTGEATGDGATDPPAPAGAPTIAWATPVTTPGSSVLVRTDVAIAGVEVRVGGVRLSDPPILYATDPERARSALYALPPGLGPGATTLSVRARGGATDSDVVDLAVVPASFVDVAAATGLHQVHDITGHPPECAWSSTGLAFADIDGDGDSDAYLGNVGRAGRLLRNDGDPSGDGLPDFVEITEAAGLAAIDDVSSASFMDYDNDGDRDLFVGRRGANVLLQNRLQEDGAAVFVDVSAETGVDEYAQRTMGVAWGDYDGDADLDLYVVNHAWCFPVPGSELDPRDHLYRNDGGVFTEVTDLLVAGPPSPLDALGFSAVWLDHDADGDPDLIVINDDIVGLSRPNALWRNDGPGDAPGAWRFTEVGAAAGLAIPRDGDKGVNGMGLAVGDVDRDGDPDLAFSNIGANYLLRNAGDGTFVDASAELGVRRATLPWKQTSVTWAAHLLDHDNDGDLDLYFSGGKIHGDALIPDAFLRNDGGRFTDATWAVGLTHLASGKASALVDLDRDGALEFATAHWGADLRVYHNRVAAPGRWLAVDLVGATVNREALGSVVRVTTPGGATQSCFRTPNPSLGAGGELTCHFGLGAATEIEALTITWPDGSVTTPPPPPVNTRVTYTQ